MRELNGIEKLRRAVKLFDACNESFNYKFTPEELLRLAEASLKCKWDFFPDQWTERQIRECLQFNIVPDWEEDEFGVAIPKYSKESDTSFHVGVSWTCTAEVRVNAASLPEAVALLETTLPTPNNGTYLPDSFSIDEERTVEMNGGVQCYL